MKNKRVMFVAGIGGHLTQLLQTESLFDNYKYVLITEKYEATIKLKEKYNVRYLRHISKNQKILYPLTILFNSFLSLYYFIRYTPNVIVSTGPNTAAAMCCLGKLFGKKVIFIESYAKRSSPSITGKWIYKLHAYTTFVVQWENMMQFYPNAEYWGGIY
jgi:UDP-N-acetylglucosamine:LPS N-acetylglucosamine transferase